MIPVPRHLNKKPLIAGLEPIELLGVAALLIGTNILAKALGQSGLLPALFAAISFAALKFLRRGKARGHFIFVLRQQFRPPVTKGYLRSADGISRK